MNIAIHPEFINRVKNIGWFSNLFARNVESRVLVAHYYVSSWEEAKMLHEKIEWEWAITNADNSVAIHLGDNYPDLFQIVGMNLLMK